MSYQQTFTCDVCGAVRQESNHWWIAIPVVIASQCKSHSELIFRSWDDVLSTERATIHLCGESCAATQLTRYFAAQKTRNEAA